MKCADFLKDSFNVYRTRNFIVKQVLAIKPGEHLDNFLISQDTFYARTPARDAEYEKLFKKRFNIDGKRLPSTASTRRYVD